MWKQAVCLMNMHHLARECRAALRQPSRSAPIGILFFLTNDSMREGCTTLLFSALSEESVMPDLFRHPLILNFRRGFRHKAGMTRKQSVVHPARVASALCRVMDSLQGVECSSLPPLVLVLLYCANERCPTSRH